MVDVLCFVPFLLAQRSALTGLNRRGHKLWNGGGFDSLCLAFGGTEERFGEDGGCTVPSIFRKLEDEGNELLLLDLEEQPGSEKVRRSPKQ